MSIIHSFLKRYSKNKYLLVLFGLTLVINLVFIRHFSDLEYGIPDLQLHYTSNQFYDLMEKYDEHQLQAYANGIILLDFIYPLVYSLFLGLFLFRLSQKPWMGLLPFGILFFDVLENCTVLYLVYRLPLRNDFITTLAGNFTFIKWIFAAVSLSILFVLIVRSLIRRYKRKKSS